MFTRNFDLMTIHTTLPRHLTFTVKTENWVSAMKLDAAVEIAGKSG